MSDEPAAPHDEEDGHAHGKVFGAAPMGRAFAVGIALNVTFVVVESVYGRLAHSMALVADAAHNLGDVMGLCLAWGAAVLARRKASAQRTLARRVSAPGRGRRGLARCGGSRRGDAEDALVVARPRGGTGAVRACPREGRSGLLSIAFGAMTFC